MSKAKNLAKKQANAIQQMLKHKEELHLETRKETQSEHGMHYLFDVFYMNVNGTLTCVVNPQGELTIASLNLSNGSIYTLQNNTYLRKLCDYAIEQIHA